MDEAPVSLTKKFFSIRDKKYSLEIKAGSVAVDQEWAIYRLWAKYNLLRVYANKTSLGHRHAHLLLYSGWLLLCNQGRTNTRDRDCVISEAKPKKFPRSFLMFLNVALLISTTINKYLLNEAISIISGLLSLLRLQ